MSRVLVVDDQDLILTLVRDILSGGGHEVGLASSGEDALDLLKDESFDLMISDVSMPGMSGLELLRRVKRERSQMQVVMLTGYAREHDISEFLLSGADEYIAKPFTAGGLLDVVRRLLDRAEKGSTPEL